MAAKSTDHSRLVAGNTAYHNLCRDASKEEIIEAKPAEIIRLRKYQHKYADSRPK